jgi:hypothetical protein
LCASRAPGLSSLMRRTNIGSEVVCPVVVLDFVLFFAMTEALQVQRQSKTGFHVGMDTGAVL